MTSPTVEIVHDYLVQMGGGEQVVASLHQAYPHASIFTSVVDREKLINELRSARIRESWMRWLPGVRKHFKAFLPLYPLAFRLKPPLTADVALISSSGFAHAVRVSNATTTVCYCHTPPRFIWAADEYLRFEQFSAFQKSALKILLKLLEIFDYHAARKIDYFIANSEFVRARIKSVYGRDAVVIYPPVKLSEMAPKGENGDYYLILARLVSYKRIDIAVRAFTESRRRLIVVGDGPDRERLQRMAGPSVTFTGWLPRQAMLEHLHRCYALLFPGLEDFGIAPVEAQACGKPVLAFGAGGALETVVKGETGLFFNEQTPESLLAALPEFESVSWDWQKIAAHASTFGEARFIREIQEFIERVGNRRSASPRGSLAKAA